MSWSTPGGPRPVHLLARIAASLVVATILTLAGPIPVAQAQGDDSAQPDRATDGLEVEASTIYVPDPANEKIDVTATYTMTNVQADEVIEGSVRSFYFTKWVIAIPANVTEFSALGDGQQLTTVIEPAAEATNVAFAYITLPFDLHHTQTVSIEVSYTIPGGVPRGGSAGARVNESFLSFSVWTSGDPNMTDVRIAIPYGFTMNVQGDLDELISIDENGEGYLQALAIDDPRSFFGQIYGRNDAGLITEWAELPGAQATVRAWPDDPDWASFVVEAIEHDVPVIEELIGIDWPAGNIEVIETVTPYLYGYGGWFNASSGQIEIGESLERDLILHELAHAWFNDTLVDGRWITEGLAEEFAARTIEATRTVRPSDAATEPAEPDLDDPLRVPLAEWASPWSSTEEDAFAYEAFHYNASWWVIRQITNDIGLDAFADVLTSLHNDEIAYLGEGPIERTSEPTQWTHLFDLLEIRAGADGLDELFSTYVLSPAMSERLQERRAAVDTYTDLVEAAGSWAVPLVIRRDLSAWDFDDALVNLDEAAAVVQLRDSVASSVAALNVVVDDAAEVPFETALATADLDAVRTDLLGVRRNLIDLQRKRAELEQLAAAIDTTIVFEEMTLADAQAHERQTRSTIATLRRARQDVEVRAGDLGLLPPAWPTGPEVTDFDAAASLAQARQATLDAIEGATAAASTNRIITQRVGLWGADVEHSLTEARAAFEADELAHALEAAARTESMLAQAAATGRRRLIWTGVGIVVAVAALSFLVHLRRRAVS